MKILDIGAGFHKYPGAISVDINEKYKPDVLWDLNIYPWPFKDDEFDLLYTSHCLEHISNPMEAIKEMWRITKPNGRIILIVPHFSSRLAWTDIEHTRAFSSNLFRRFTGKFSESSGDPVRFEIGRIKFRWQPRIDKEFIPSGIKKLLPLVKLINDIISGLANFNIEFCERIWCYYVGGIGEVHFRVKVIK